MADYNYNYNWIPNAKAQREAISAEELPKTKGIASKPIDKAAVAGEPSYYDKMFDLLFSSFSSEEEADKVLSGSKPDRDALKNASLSEIEKITKASAMLAVQERNAAGITRSLTLEDVAARNNLVSTEDVAAPNNLVGTEDVAAPNNLVGTEEVAGTGAGLMSDPRKPGEADHAFLTRITKNIIEGTDKEELKETQSRLKALGFYENAVDGLTGPATKSAIKTFQHKNGLEVTGIADEWTRLKLAQVKGLIAQEKPKGTLLSAISMGEGGYGAANNGTSKLAKKFSISDGYYSDTYSKPLTEMTVNEIMNAQVGTTGKTTEELLAMNPKIASAQRDREVFAVGAYQIIPETLWAAVKEGAIDGATVFEPKVQDKIAIDFLAGSDRTKLRDFLQGNPNVSVIVPGYGKVLGVEAAMIDLAKQWASFPAPMDIPSTHYLASGKVYAGPVHKVGKEFFTGAKPTAKSQKLTTSRAQIKGASWYGSGNKAQHSVAETKAMLLQARDENVL